MISHRNILPLVLLFVVFISNFAAAQTYPQDLDYSPRTEALLDAGELWNINSLLHPLKCCPLDSSVKSTDIKTFKWLANYLTKYSVKANQPTDLTQIGVNVLALGGIALNHQAGSASDYNNVALQPYIWLQAKFRHNWYARLYIRATNEKESLPHFTGIPRDISRFGLNAAEFDQSVIGYRDKWVNLEYGRAREIWGPMTEDNLILSGSAPSYERLLMQISLGRFTYRYQFGFLETVRDTDFINRYIVIKCLQYSNRRNLIVGMSEALVLAGINRPLDLAYLNPLNLHIETDLNNRSTSAAKNYNNAVYTLHLDWLARNNLRLTASLAVDEFKLERQEIKQGEPDIMGYLFRTAWTPMKEPMGLTFIGKYVRLDTYFGQHSYAYVNFVNRDYFIGHPIGNDADQVAAAARMVFKYPIMAEIEFGRRRWGDNSLINNAYAPIEDYRTRPFPSGAKRENRYLALRINSHPLKSLSFSMDGQIDLTHNGKQSSLEKYDFIIRYQLPLTLLIL